MREILQQIRRLLADDQWQLSAHAVRELAADNILIEPLIFQIDTAIVIDDYPNYHKGPCVLVLQFDENGAPIHLLWGIPKGQNGPASLVTAYRPDVSQWTADFRKRRSKE